MKASNVKATEYTVRKSGSSQHPAESRHAPQTHSVACSSWHSAGQGEGKGAPYVVPLNHDIIPARRATPKVPPCSGGWHECPLGGSLPPSRRPPTMYQQSTACNLRTCLCSVGRGRQTSTNMYHRASKPLAHPALEMPNPGHRTLIAIKPGGRKSLCSQ
jgi:hypothetical protein